MTAEERAFNYESTQKPTKLQVGEIAKHYNNGYQQAFKDFMERLKSSCTLNSTMVQSNGNIEKLIEQLKKYMQDESET